MKMRRIISYILILALTPAIIIAGTLLLPGKFAVAVSVAAAAAACAAFALTFEHGRHTTAKVVLIAALTALTVAGRILFYFLPGFKPVTALVILTGMYFGSESGFMTGAMAALLSNIYFGQGPWTPFQMLTWGLIGFVAGIASSPMKRSRVILILYSVFAGAVYSILMDVFSAVWADDAFNISSFLALFVSSLPFMALYAASNAIFILLIAGPFGRRAERIITKYGL